MSDCSPNLTITDEAALVMAHSGSAHGYNSVRAEMCVEFVDFNLYPHFDKYIACYFEVEIQNHCGVGIGGKSESNDLFQQGDVIGCGMLQCRQNSSLKFFATYNGILLDLIELSDKFQHYGFFPTICLAFRAASARANFGKEQFCFDRSELFKKINFKKNQNFYCKMNNTFV